MRRVTVLGAVVALALSVVQVSAQSNGGFDHRAHSVPGPDQTVYDLDGNGRETIHLNGIGSHSHFFNAGPPVVSGVIVSFSWMELTTNKQICVKMECDTDFPVGTTQVRLTVVDNTGDTVHDTIAITVLPKSALSQTPHIDVLSPNEGQAVGKNLVTIDGAFLYRDSRVYFGSQRGSDITYVSLNRITCLAPGGVGTVTVIIVSDVGGTSNGLQYTFQVGRDNVPIRFLFDTWTNPDKSEFVVEEITSITIGKDHRYYMGSLLGTVTVAYVDRDLVVQSSCSGGYMGAHRSITGIAFNPVDPYERLFVTTNTHFHVKNDERWDSAKVESVELGADRCPVRGPTIISGLPTSNHDHGTNVIAFMADGKMLITVGSFSNAGASKPGDGIGGVPENPLSASIVVADYLRPNFDGDIKYDQYDNPETANQISGDVTIYAAGVRNSFGIIYHSNGQVYATDNGPNTGFGARSVTCTEDGPDPEADDKLLRILPGMYYGHPNRNRGRTDPGQCKYRAPSEASTGNYMKEIGTMSSSTNGIIEYRANTFNGALKGELLMSKVAFGAEGLVWRASLTPNGTLLKSQPYQFFQQSGVSLVMGLYGELVMPQLKKYRVLALRPDEPGELHVDIISVHPNRGPKSGGTEVFITGHFLNSIDLVITFGGKACTNIADVKYQHVRCITPAGTGKVPVIITSEGISSESRGHEFEYL